MRLDAISIDTFLSCKSFEWRNLDPHLNMVVGPNGVGNTNLFQAVQVVRHLIRKRGYVSEQLRLPARW